MGFLFSVNDASKIMRERTLEVLVYLFDHYIDEWQDWGADLEDVEIELLGAGFGEKEINSAFLWLEGLLVASEREGLESIFEDTLKLTRVYVTEERIRLGQAGESLLNRLFEIGVLSLSSREMVIDRVMELGLPSLSLDYIKWIVLLVLNNQPGEGALTGYVESLVNNDSPRLLH